MRAVLDLLTNLMMSQMFKITQKLKEPVRGGKVEMEGQEGEMVETEVMEE